MTNVSGVQARAAAAEASGRSGGGEEAEEQLKEAAATIEQWRQAYDQLQQQLAYAQVLHLVNIRGGLNLNNPISNLKWPKKIEVKLFEELC